MDIYVVSNTDLRVRGIEGQMLTLTPQQLVATLREEKSKNGKKTIAVPSVVRAFASLEQANKYALTTDGEIMSTTETHHWVVFKAKYSGRTSAGLKKPNGVNVLLRKVELKQASLAHVEAGFPPIEVEFVNVNDAVEYYIKRKQEAVAQKEKLEQMKEQANKEALQPLVKNLESSILGAIEKLTDKFIEAGKLNPDEPKQAAKPAGVEPKELANDPEGDTSVESAEPKVDYGFGLPPEEAGKPEEADEKEAAKPDGDKPKQADQAQSFMASKIAFGFIFVTAVAAVMMVGGVPAALLVKFGFNASLMAKLSVAVASGLTAYGAYFWISVEEDKKPTQQTQQPEQVTESQKPAELASPKVEEINELLKNFNKSDVDKQFKTQVEEMLMLATPENKPKALTLLKDGLAKIASLGDDARYAAEIDLMNEATKQNLRVHIQ